jgi:hypothetical protein
MSTVKTNNVQVGQSATATNNFTLYQPATPDGTVRLGVGNSGATTSDVVTVTDAGNMTVSGSVTAATGTVYPIVSGTAQASTSGLNIDFTGIPSWVKRITVMFSGVSTNGTSSMLVQLGTGATPTYTTSGYLGAASTSTGATITNFSTGFMVNNSVAAASVVHGNVVITNISSTSWTESGVLGLSDSANNRTSGGSVTLGDTLTALRITTVTGVNTFDAGTINILYE